MQYVSAEEKAALDRRVQDLYKQQIAVQERIRTAAGLGDLSENAEYHFAKEENRSLEKELKDLQAKLKNVAVVNTDDLPDDMVFLGRTVRLKDLDDDSEQLVKIVGEAETPRADSDVLPVSSSSPMGEALMKSRVGDKVQVKAPRGTMEFEVMELL